MGLDYIRAQTGKPWRKRWDGGLDRLKAPTLLDLTMSEASRVVTAQLDPAARVKAGDTLIVQSAGDGLVVSDGLRSIGRIANPTSEMTTAVRDSGGYAQRRAPARWTVRRHRGDRREMNRRPAHEPSRQFRQPQRLWDDATRHAPSLGCPTCLERDRCGGVHTDAGILDCRDLCTCADKSKCDMVCRFNPGLFVARMQRGRRAQLRQCATHKRKRRADASSRRAVRRSSLRPRCSP